MKKLVLSFCLSVLIVFQFFAQTGSSCTEPDVIPAIPYSQQGLTTAGLFNYYMSTPCGNNYISGKDYVFTYTPAVSQNIKVTLSNTTAYGVGVFILDACPSDTDANCIAFNEGQNGNPVIPSAALIANTTYYIIVSTYNFAGLNPETPFDINISLVLPWDASVRFLNAPYTSCNLGVETFNIRLWNYGLNPISDFDVAFTVNDGPEMISHCSSTIPPNSAIYFSYDTSVDMSVYGATYRIKCYTKLQNDQNTGNDTAYDNRTKSIVVSSFPYYEDFESGPGGWVAEWRDDFPCSWQLGTPNDTALDHAASGTKAWKTNLAGFYSDEEFSYITGPCFDLSAINTPWVDCSIWYEQNELDFFKLEASIDYGAHWFTIGNPDEGTNWYNTPQGSVNDGWYGYSGNWITAKHALDTLGGKPHVQLRFIFKPGSNGVNEGVAVDDIRIYEAPFKNLGVVSVTNPGSGCGLVSTENIGIRFVNFGLQPQVNFNVAYRLNNNSWITELVNDTIYPGDTMDYTFTQQADFSGTGNYHLTARTELANDLDTTNDSISVNIYNFPDYSTYPHFQDFEQNDGGWAASGENPSLEWGQITDTVITHAASGSRAWKTNIDGPCNELEDSYLTGPCFNLTGLLNPYVKFNIWYETLNAFYNGIIFEFSIDNGTSWVNLGSASDLNWYNQGYNFIGQGGDWKAARHSLMNNSGQPHIQFRFHFQSAINMPGFAFDDFKICDAPVAEYIYSVNWPQVAFDCPSAGATTWHWDFGNGDTSVLRNPVYSFSDDTNIVTLIVGNDCNTDTIVKTIIHCSPVAGFTYTMNWPQVAFNCPSAVATSWDWSFGDGGTSGIKNPVHTYQHDTNTVTLIAGNSCGSDTIVQTIIHCAPFADFTYSATNWPQVSFQNTSTNNASANTWDFGDGDSSVVANPVHTYSNANDSNYVTLISSNSCGSDTITILITRTGVSEIMAEKIRIYPNPADKEIYIDFPDELVHADLVLTNALGRIIYSKKITSPAIQNKIDVSGLSKGVYFIQVKKGEFLVNKKIIFM